MPETVMAVGEAAPGRVGDGEFVESGSPSGAPSGAPPAAPAKPAASKPAAVKAATSPTKPAAPAKAEDEPIESAILMPVDESAAAEGDEDAAADSAEGEGEVKEGDTPAVGGFDLPTVPEGMTLDEGLLTGLAPALEEAKAKGLGQEWLQKITDGYAAHVQALGERAAKEQMDGYRAQQREFLEQLRNDPEFGGDQYQETRRLSGIGLAKFFGREAFEIFEITGAANHPTIVKGLAKIGKAFSEHPVVLGGGVTDDGAELSDAEVLFGKR